MYFEEIIHGTQYYRAPTPIPEEWESDIARMEAFQLDAFQIRINWRWCEKKEGVYDFSDVDRVMELAEKYGRKVIIKFLLECAPQYVFDKYGGTRIGPKGEQYRGGSHGAFYGGWLPCFTNPKVREAAARFVERVAERYHGCKNVILWNAWNEIRNRPVWECFCPHCRAAFGEHLREKYGTIDNLNQFYGAAEESFETIALPMMPHGFWDIYEFKKFKGGKSLYENLRFVYDSIRKYDKERPIMAHVGFPGAFQNSIDDVCDDYTVSKAVDFWGTSIPCACNMSTHENRMDFLMLNDFLRAIDENYFLHEIYPGLGMFKYEYDTPYDMSFKLYAALASGAKGLIYWQYRAERLGHEHDCAGIMRMDGSPREVAYSVQKFGEDMRNHTNFFAKAKVKKAQVAIVYDFNSMLMSEIEDGCGEIFSLDKKPTQLYYRNAHAGMYRLMMNCDYAVDYVSVTKPEQLVNYKVLYFPYYTMLDSAIVPYLQKFLENGGILLADEGFGMRAPNTWMQVYDIDCKPLMNARMRERRLVKQNVQVLWKNKMYDVAPYKTEYHLEKAETVMQFDDGSPAVQRVNYGKGQIYLFGFSIGYSAYEAKAQIWEEILEEILIDANVKRETYSDCKNGFYVKCMSDEEKEAIFFFNNSGQEKCIKPEQEVLFVGGDGTCDGDVLTIPENSMAYVILKAQNI